AWWWYGDPWFGYYSYYWHPYPIYYGPSFWLTDYVIADILAASYERERAYNAARANAAANAALDDRIKSIVRSEVEDELRARQHQKSVPLSKTVSPGYVHVITKDLDVAVASSDESCTLTPGDVVRVAKAPGENDSTVEMKVVTSKRGGCAPNKRILVSM